MPRQTSGAITGLEMLEGVFDWVLRIAAVALIGVTGYYLYGALAASGTLFRGVGPTGQAMSAADFLRHLSNMQLLTKILIIAAVLVAASAIGRYYGFPETGAALLVVGAILFFGVPYLIQQGNSGGGIENQALLKLIKTQPGRYFDPRSYLIGRFNLAGMILGGAGVLQLLVHGIMMAASMTKRRPKPNAENAKTAAQVKKAKDKFLGSCWDLPFCRDTEKKLCPIRATNKSCWRTGRGCYCDQNVILTLSGGNQYQASRGATGYMARSAATVSRPKSFSEKREQCLQCPVYLHRQGQKYKVLAPLSLVLSVGGLVYFSTQILSGYKSAMLALGQRLAGFSFGSGPGTSPQWATDLATNSGIMWLLIVVGGLLIVAYLLHGVEWVLYRLGI